MIRRLIILLLIVGWVFSQKSPPEDETYLELKKKKIEQKTWSLAVGFKE